MHPEVSGLDRGVGGGSGGYRDRSGREPAPGFWQRRWRLKAVATELENLLLALRNHSDLRGGKWRNERDGRKADSELKESMFPAVCPRGLGESAHGALGAPYLRIMGHTQSPRC